MADANVPLISSLPANLLSPNEDQNDPMTRRVMQPITETDLSETFLHMEYRKLIRITSGSYKVKPNYWLWVLLYGAVFGAYVGVLIYQGRILAPFVNPGESVSQADVYNDWKSVILVALIGSTLAPVGAKMLLLASSFSVFWAYMMICWFFAFPISFAWAVFSLLCLYALTWLSHFIYHYPMPWFVKKSGFCFAWRRVLHTDPLRDGDFADEDDDTVSIGSANSLPPVQDTARGSAHSASAQGSGYGALLEAGEEAEEATSASSSAPLKHSGSAVDLYGALEDGMFYSGIRGPEPSPGVGFALQKEEDDQNIRRISFQYVSVLRARWLTCQELKTFQYHGAMRNGRPHGWGVWRDDTFYGESLEGYWDDGIPVGPFESCEMGTGNTFRSVRVAYCTARAAWACLPDAELGDKLRYGVACFECSIAGSFYASFPRVEWLDPEGESVQDVLPMLLHLDENQPSTSIIVTATPEGLYIADHQPESDASRDSAVIRVHRDVDTTANGSRGIMGEEAVIGSLPDINAVVGDTDLILDSMGVPLPSPHLTQLSIDGWRTRTAPEAVVFLHGYNIPLEWSMKKFAQLIAAGRFPSFIKPFVFSWPTGKVFSYFCALDATKNERTIADFTEFVISLRDAGIRKLHFLTHSMGVRVLCSVLESAELRKVFRVAANRATSTPQAGPVDLMDIRTITLCNPDYSLKEFRDRHYRIMHRLCHHINIYVDKLDNALWYSEIFTRSKSLGRLNRPLYAGISGARCLDVDVVDSSGLQDNMHTVRHSAFNVNRVMVRDIYEIIVEGKRAHQRVGRLARKRGNFFTFMNTPSAVTGSIV